MLLGTFTGEKNCLWFRIIPDTENKIRNKPMTSDGHLWYLRKVFIWDQKRGQLGKERLKTGMMLFRCSVPADQNTTSE